MKEDLSTKSSYAEQVEMCVSTILETKRDVSKEDMTFSADSFAKRVLAGSKYKPKTKLNGDICLIKASKPSSITIQGNDYNLHEVSLILNSCH